MWLGDSDFRLGQEPLKAFVPGMGRMMSLVPRMAGTGRHEVHAKSSVGNNLVIHQAQHGHKGLGTN